MGGGSLSMARTNLGNWLVQYSAQLAYPLWVISRHLQRKNGMWPRTCPLREKSGHFRFAETERPPYGGLSENSQCFDMLKLARSSAFALQLSRSAASTLQV